MSEQGRFQERAVKVPRPKRHFRLLVAADGKMLAMNSEGLLELSEQADDRVIWDRVRGGIRHVGTGKVFPRGANDAVRIPNFSVKSFRVARGPEKLPSEYLATLRREGWVCLTCILTPETVDELQRAACTDAYEHLEFNDTVPRISLHSSVGKTVAEPVSLWLIREYMGTQDVRVGHPPGFAVLSPDDGKRRVQRWHSDFPYNAANGGEYKRTAPPVAVQRNVCISDFTKFRGATAFKLGSHAVDADPPSDWNPANNEGEPYDREVHGLPYTGPDADVVEAPAGSIILYDARTWHRAGFNRSNHKRAAMLQAMLASRVKRKRETSFAYEKFLASPACGGLNAREQGEVRRLMAANA